MSKITFHFTKPSAWGICTTCNRMTPVKSFENYTMREILRTNGETLNLVLDPSTETAFKYEDANHPVIKIKPKSPNSLFRSWTGRYAHREG
ncbi:hypothetical protein CEXT_156781 [Caerostris extrusa]|uniref:Uncharacterized protein n=1 Tax=Caerostris extrusa TaxID=172846 RepID=A0AAV4P2D1_CAEEX|nr:hypothetical protein CEXT_156781 [Caerostris extrusa]